MEIPKIENINSGTITEKYISLHYPEFYKYITEHYPTDLKWTEKLYWYYHDINDYPRCPTCGKKVKFINFIKGYKIFCSDKCSFNSDYVKEKRKQTWKEKYGVENPFQLKETLEKRKQTWKEKYGVENPAQNPNILNQRKNTWKEKYGAKNIFQSDIFKEKRKQTLIKRYSTEVPCQNKEILNKYKQTCLNRFGVENPNQNQQVQEKRKQTNLKKYGVEAATQNPKIQNKRKQTNLKKYGFEIATQSPEIQHKRYLTQKKNHSFNTSQIEEDFSQWLTENNIKFERQYHSEKYPFACDFYFPDKDLYLEVQGSWTHGFHPFDPDSEDDINTLNEWREKDTDYYNNAIETWTERDPLKRKVAEENHLNWIEVFSDDLNDLVDIVESF